MLFMRFALQVKPKNRLLFSCHFANECAQLMQLARLINYKYKLCFSFYLLLFFCLFLRYGTPQPMKQYQVPSTTVKSTSDIPSPVQPARSA
jgi:hypothetical protein